MGDDVSEPSPYVVIRPAPDLPPGYLPPGWDGRWLHREAVDASTAYGDAAAHPTGRYETRGDGERAEVLEIRPAR